jgi:4-hydroxy 2-oxovalerate aldolase
MPMMDTLKWGYHLPYMITGVHNQHPRAGMAMVSRESTDYRAFWDEITAEEPVA